MASENSAQEKTEDPTPKRMEKAFEDGQVLSSKELFVFSTLFTGLILYFLSVGFAGQILGEWGGFFNFNMSEFEGELSRLSYQAVRYIIFYGLLIGAPLFIIVLFTQGALAGRINFAPKALEFKGSRIDPLKGLQRMFSVKSLVELAKSILKVVFLIGSAALIINSQISTLLTASDSNISHGVSRAHGLFISLFITLLIVLVIIALIDVIWQRHQYIEQLKMSRQDVKDEQKQTEGSPEVKAKIRRLQMASAAQAAKQRSALENVPEATAIITNPTHFAVALKYDVGERGAPVILAMGRGKLAEEIIEIGSKESIAIFQSPFLARALFFTGDIGEEISEELFNSVAAVLAFIFRLANGEDVAAPEIDVPENLKFTETGALYNA